MRKVCAIDGCEKFAYGKGFCEAHYTRLRRYGDPLGTGTVLPRGLTKEERFESKIIKTENCWLWTGKIADNGYGHFSYRENGQGTTVLVHRFAYELWVGPVPEGLTIDHVAMLGCINKHCVNPAHLEPITSAEQNRRYYGVWESCTNGHAYTPENTKIDSAGHRICRECGRERGRKHWRDHHPLPSG